MTIEEYLSELRAKLQVGPIRKRRILREIEGHLLDAVHEARIAGASRQEAERRAIERFGPADFVGKRFSEPNRTPIPVGRGARAVVFAGAVLALATAAALSFTFGREGDQTVTLHGRISLMSKVTDAGNMKGFVVSQDAVVPIPADSVVVVEKEEGSITTIRFAESTAPHHNLRFWGGHADRTNPGGVTVSASGGLPTIVDNAMDALYDGSSPSTSATSFTSGGSGGSLTFTVVVGDSSLLWHKFW